MIPVNMTALSCAIESFKNGKPVIIMDSHERENEGDLCLPAQYASAENVLFFLQNSTGIICVACNPLRIDQLELPAMTQESTDPNGTPFTVSVDLAKDTTTGVSAQDKAKTIAALADTTKISSDFTRPGHIYPLRASPKGLRGRQGHTEASVELCKMAGVYPACMIAELMFMSGPMAGEMMRLEHCREFSEKHSIPLITIQELIDALPMPVAELPVSCKDGITDTKIHVFQKNQVEYIVLEKGSVHGKDKVPIRLHSECLTGDVLGSQRCDCGSQLKIALDALSKQDHGLFVYIRGHEGRGIGLSNKIEAYHLQDTQGLDTIEANHQLYLPGDCRSYEHMTHILKELNAKSVILYSNNPKKAQSLGSYLDSVVPFIGETTTKNKDYLKSKQKLWKNTKKFGVVYTTSWHSSYVQDLVKAVQDLVTAYDIILQPVSGSYELISGTRKLIKKGANVVLALGILMKGETDHYQFIAEAVTQGLVQLQVKHDIDIVNGLLTVHNEEQIKARVYGERSCIKEWVNIALQSLQD